jgi:hypothetical protein
MEILNGPTEFLDYYKMHNITALVSREICRNPSVLHSFNFIHLYFNFLSQYLSYTHDTGEQYTTVFNLLCGSFFQIFRSFKNPQFFSIISEEVERFSLIQKFLSFSDSSNPSVSAYSIMILFILHYKREWNERELFLERLFELSASMDKIYQENISDFLSDIVYQ